MITPAHRTRPRRKVVIECRVEEARATAQALEDVLSMAGDVGEPDTAYHRRLHHVLRKLQLGIEYVLVVNPSRLS